MWWQRMAHGSISLPCFVELSNDTRMMTKRGQKQGIEQDKNKGYDFFYFIFLKK
jgi:hypothetical protein